MTTTNRQYSSEALNAIREKLANTSGPEYWRSLDELAQTDTFKEYIHNEFPEHASAPLNNVTRRNFLQVMGATLAFAGVTTGCARQPNETIHPYVKMPEELVPGKPRFYATTFVQDGYANGVIVENHMGRPTKIEGLPEHPSTAGGADSQTQASILDLFDPDRLTTVTKNGNIKKWDNFVAEARAALADYSLNDGAGVAILTETITSPTLAAQLQQLKEMYPKAGWYQFSPTSRDNAKDGSKLAFGEVADVIFDFTKAKRIVSLDSDFLDSGPGHMRYSADFSKARDVVDDDAPSGASANHGEDAAEGGSESESDDVHSDAVDPNFHSALPRMYAFESSSNIVGASADHRWPLRPSQIEAVARLLAARLGGGSVDEEALDLPANVKEAVGVIVTDLLEHEGESLVVVGDHQPAAVHALGHVINNVLGNVGETVNYIDPVEANPVNQVAQLQELVSNMDAGDVKFLVIIDANPVYTAPADLNFLEALEKVPLRAKLGRYQDETATYCHWQIPGLHYMETWGDARGHDGTVSVIQKQVEPLYGGKSASQLLSALLDESERSDYDILRDYWMGVANSETFESDWVQALSAGFVAGTATALTRPPLRENAIPAYQPTSLGEDELEVVFLPDPCIGDGTYSNNAWLQELPKPMSKLTWDNAVVIGYSTALHLNLKNEDLVEVSVNGRTVQGPVWVQPGQASNTVTLHQGFGRESVGLVGVSTEDYPLGFNAYQVQTSDAPTIGSGVKLTNLGKTYPLARTEQHYNMEGRDLVRHFTHAEYDAHPDWVVQGRDHDHHVPGYEETMLKPDEKKWDGYAWGMTIDLNKCTGCNACITACQSENIIPVVGKTEVMKGREMHWIRVDRYFSAKRAGLKYGVGEKGKSEDTLEELDNPTVYYQPVPCQQCENASCELVCPVSATVHSKEGLNDMVYNRCIGTRYCSNNCPYKVRRFNFYHYSRTPLGSRGDRVKMYNPKQTHIFPDSLKPMRNPDVTVRTRGVMEKCTYCVQRINLARIDSKISGDAIPDGRIQMACQQACPSKAIEFGDINNHDSIVTHKKQLKRNYSILGELNTKPRTTYLARLTNPNPEIMA